MFNSDEAHVIRKALSLVSGGSGSLNKALNNLMQKFVLSDSPDLSQQEKFVLSNYLRLVASTPPNFDKMDFDELYRYAEKYMVYVRRLNET